MKHLFLLLVLCGLAPLSAQNRSLSGMVVQASDDAPMEFVSVCLLNTDSIVVQFSRTNQAGYWRLEVPDTHQGYLSFTFLGYEKQVVPLAQCTDGMTVRLREASIHIREVQVKSGRIWQRNDTLTYNVAGFSLPQDRTIEDVLKKIPGIEVAQSGLIKYQGKSINKLYIEGMDLLGSKYALATKNMPAKMVKNVQVLQSHQPIAALRGKSFSDRAALNLVLEEHARYRLIGIIDLGAGVNDHGKAVWENRLIGMMFGHRMQNLTMYKNNNTGTNLASEIRALGQSMGSPSAVSNNESNFFSASPSVVKGLDRERYLDNNAHLLAVNHLYKPQKDRDLRLQLTAIHDEQTSGHSEETAYYYPSQTLVVTEDESYHAQLNQLDIDLGYQRNDQKMYLKDNLRGILSLHKTLLDLLTNGTALQQRIRPQRKYLQNDFELIRNSGNHTLSFYSANSYTELPQNLTVMPGPYADWLNAGNDYEVLQQTALLRAFHSHTYTYFQHRLAGLYLKYRAGVNYQNRSLQSDVATDGTLLDDQAYTNHLRLQAVEGYLEPSLNLKQAIWQIEFRLPLTYHYSTLHSRLPAPLRLHSHKFMPKPSLRFKYALTGKWELSGSSYLSFMQPTIGQLYAGYLFSSYRTARAYEPQLWYDTYWQNLLSLKFNNPIRGFFLTLSGNYTQQRKEMLYRYTPVDTYLSLSEALHSPHTARRMGGSARLSKAFDWRRLYIALSGSWTRTDDRMMLEAEPTDYRMTVLSLSGQVTMEPVSFLNFEAESRASQTCSQQFYEGAPGASRVWSYAHTADINVIISSHWQLQVKNRITHDNRNRVATYFMDARVTYTNKQWMIQLVGHNLLNCTRLSAVYLNDWTRQTSTSVLRPRELLAKVNFSF